MKHRTLVIGAAAVVLLAGWLWFKPKAKDPNKGPPAVAVDVATVTAEDVPVYAEGLGTVQAFYTVQVTARVDGQVEKVAFTEGQDVRKGALRRRSIRGPSRPRSTGAIAAARQGQGHTGERAGCDWDATSCWRRRISPANRPSTRRTRARRAAAARSSRATRPRSTTPARSSTTHHPLAHRRPYRHPPGGPGQHRARRATPPASWW